MTIWFTSDTHFGHANALAYCNRQFATADEMDAAMIDRWNAVVGDGDTVYHLGDFTLGGPWGAAGYFSQLSGHICVLRNEWHHDKRWIDRRPYVSASGHHVVMLPPMVVLELPEYGKDGHNQPLVLCHYPLAEWDRAHYRAWHLHGHSHGNYHYPAGSLAFDAGVDCHNFTPINLGVVMRQMMAYGWQGE